MTKLLAKLAHEARCVECHGCGISYNKRYNDTCPDCNGNGKVWYRISFTYASSYEEALEKLLTKRNLWRTFDPKDKFFLVWGRSSNKNERPIEPPIDITRAVDYRIRDWTAKEIYKRLKTNREVGKLNYILGLG